MVVVPTEETDSFALNGYAIAGEFFSLDKVTFLIDHYMKLREADSYAGDFSGVDARDDDPLKDFPRMIHMHRWDAVSLDWMIDPRIARLAREVDGIPGLCRADDALFQARGLARPGAASRSVLFEGKTRDVCRRLDGSRCL